MIRRLIVVIVVLAALGGAGFGFYRLAGSSAGVIASDGQSVPTTRVTRGTLELKVQMPGELRATKQTQITAPATGGALRIISMTETGIAVKEGDPIMEFDPADQLFAQETARSQLLEAEQEITKRQAELEVQAATDKVTLLTARFDVRRAELDAKVDETLVAANEAKIRQVSHDQAKRHLVQVEQDVASRQASTKAALAILNEQRMKASIAAERAQQSLDGLVLKSPMDGIVIVQANMDAMGGMVIYGMPMPSYRVGDTVPSGRLVVEVYDIASMEVRARVNEQERANISVGQPAVVIGDAIAGLSQSATIASIAGLGRADSRMGPMRQFDVILNMVSPDPRLRPGTTVNVIVPGRKVEKILLVPRQAVFEKDGKPIVYVRAENGFRVRDVKVLHRTESRIAVEGIDDGTEIAMIDPTQASRPATAPTPPVSPRGAGPGVSK